MKRHIPIHECSMHKIVVGFGTKRPSKGFTIFKCVICDKWWEETHTIIKSLRYEL